MVLQTLCLTCEWLLLQTWISLIHWSWIWINAEMTWEFPQVHTLKPFGICDTVNQFTRISNDIILIINRWIQSSYQKLDDCSKISHSMKSISKWSPIKSIEPNPIYHNQSRIQTSDLKLWTIIRKLEIKFDVSRYKLTQKVNCLNQIELDWTKTWYYKLCA